MHSIVPHARFSNGGELAVPTAPTLLHVLSAYAHKYNTGKLVKVVRAVTARALHAARGPGIENDVHHMK